MKIRNMWLAAGVVLAAVAPSWAQTGGGAVGGQNRPGFIKRPAPKNYFAELKDIADLLSKRYEVKVVVDPAIFVATKPLAPAENVALPAALDLLTTPLKKASWRRVYLTQAQSIALPEAGKLAAAVRALETVEQTGLVLENPATRRATSYLKNFEVPANFGESLTAQQFSPNGVYVIYSTNSLGGDGAKSMQERLLDIQKEAMEMMLQMDPDSMADAMSKGMDMLMNLDPATRNQIMGVQMRAGMQMFQRMTPAQQQELMNGVMQMFGPGGIQPPPNGRPPGGLR